MPNRRHLLGERAEEATAAWLVVRGWTILARRWRSPQGELDIVAIDPDGVLVAIEVKLRRDERTGGPLESVDRRRLGRLRSALLRFHATASGAAVERLRVDLVAVRPAPDGRWRLVHHPGIDGW